MVRILIGVLFITVMVSCQSNKNEKQETFSLSESEHLVMSTAWFQQSAEMQACYYQAFNLATLRLEQIIKKKEESNPYAVVLDIDETIMDNSPFEVYLINAGELYSSKLWKDWTDQEKARALPGAIDFTRRAKELGVEVFYISNRKTNELESTMRNMNALGFPNAQANFIQLRSDKSDKTARRKNITDHYNVVLYIGDNLTDFDEVFADRDANLGFDLVEKHKQDFGLKFIMLPNPMYGEWEGALYDNNYKRTPAEKSSLRKQKLMAY